MEITNTYKSSNALAQSSKPSSNAPSAPKIIAPNLPEEQGSSNRSQALKLQRTLGELDIPEIANNDARVELNFNQDTGRVIAKITDRASGEVIRELPSKELQQLFSQMREFLGSIVDKEI
ncbi:MULTISPECIES: flagellar protein FlaG [unclassified Thalassospira]|uniref:flagellar protein FlaG n=1 Tax=unclassified Thalassospira TaxID=2648997 RepID=UPI0007A5B14A|nr:MULTISPECIES: flagellar protein FlaG [unclassified Thalassospira]KZD00214.1 hypothetical protein AUQ41_06370 [Thalassospira sp. MCCC 1A02898]ONH87326.1 hypothetical protein TH47_13365 [Thalassospira sp. MCCC 1A02803]